MTRVFLSSRVNVRSPPGCIPIKPTSRLIFSNSTLFSASILLPLFLWSTLTVPFPFSKHISSLKAKFFPRLKTSRCISTVFSDDILLRSFSFFCTTLFFGPFLHKLLPGWFLFLSITNVNKLERLHRATNLLITSCLSSSPIPFFLSDAFLSPLRVTLNHFALFFYVGSLCLPTSFFISGLARFEVKPRLSRSYWRGFGSTAPLMVTRNSPWEAFSIFPPSFPRNPPSFRLELTFSTSCSVLTPLSRQGVALVYLDSLPSHNLVIWTNGFAFYPFGKEGSDVLVNCSLCGEKAILSFSGCPVCSSCSGGACIIL